MEFDDKEAIRAMLDGQVLRDKDGVAWWYDSHKKSFYRQDSSETFRMGVFNPPFSKERPNNYWTRWEILEWISSDSSRGWIVRTANGGEWSAPQRFSYDLNRDYQRAQLLPDKSGIDKSTIQTFVVTEEGKDDTAR
jgi:hypothetical protein